MQVSAYPALLFRVMALVNTLTAGYCVALFFLMVLGV